MFRSSPHVKWYIEQGLVITHVHEDIEYTKQKCFFFCFFFFFFFVVVVVFLNLWISFLRLVGRVTGIKKK